MKIKNNIILKNGGNLFSGTGLHRKGLLVDVRDHLKHPHNETVVVNNPTFGRVLSSKNNDDSVKIGTINESSKQTADTHSELVDQFKKISFKDKKRNNIKLEL